jgi:hypothetical protein
MRDQLHDPMRWRTVRSVRAAMLRLLRNGRMRSQKDRDRQNEEMPRAQRALSAMSE